MRDYGTEPLIWGGDSGCEHAWGEEQRVTAKVSHGQGGSTLTGGCESWGNRQGGTTGAWCQRCGAWRGSLGLEPSPELYVAHLVEISREVRRVLRDDGTLWLNLGDSYATTQAGNKNPSGFQQKSQAGQMGALAQYGGGKHSTIAGDLKSKDLVGIPWRVALALQADGWYLRSDIIWAKGLSFCDEYAGSCMPESVRDRPTKAHEHLFLLAKSKRYFYDQEAVRENFVDERMGNPGGSQRAYAIGDRNDATNSHILNWNTDGEQSGHNLRDVWAINPAGFPGAHFAVFPEALVEPCIKAGTSQKGQCPECGAPWERIMEKKRYNTRPAVESKLRDDGGSASLRNDTDRLGLRPLVDTQTTGWQPTCDCDAGDPVPCLVLDPFGGAGTTGLVAAKLGRDCVIVELNREYAEMGREYILDELGPMFTAVELLPLGVDDY